MVKESETYRFGTALFVYFIGITLLVTLLPFRFHLPARMDILFQTNLRDFFLNIFLFVPLGFLFQLSRPKNTPLKTGDVLLFGLAFSAAIEIAQLFLIGRYTSVIDVVTNGAGAWLGAWLYRFLRRYLRSQAVGLMALELPLVSLVYLLIPLQWLSGMATGKELNRLWLLLLNGFIGANVYIALYQYRLKGLPAVRPLGVSLAAVVWFIMANLPALMNFPLRILIFAVAIGVMVYGQVRQPMEKEPQDRRFEIPTLRKIIPLFALYLVLLVYWPPVIEKFQWDWMVPAGLFGDDPPIPVVLGFIEYLAACTLLGYMVAEWRGRLDRGAGWAFIPQYAFIGLVVLALEALRGVHPQHAASLFRFILATVAGIYGAVIYRLQVNTIRKILSTFPSKQSSDPN